MELLYSIWPRQMKFSRRVLPPCARHPREFRQLPGGIANGKTGVAKLATFANNTSGIPLPKVLKKEQLQTLDRDAPPLCEKTVTLEPRG